MGLNGPRVCQGLGGGECAPGMLRTPGTVQQVQSAENSRDMLSRDQKTPGDSVDVSLVYD